MTTRKAVRRESPREAKLKAQGETLYDTLRRRYRPGGLDMPRSDGDLAAALTKLLERRPELTVVKNKTNLTLMFREDVDRIFTPNMAGEMAKARVLAFSGEDLTDE